MSHFDASLLSFDVQSMRGFQKEYSAHRIILADFTHSENELSKADKFQNDKKDLTW